MTSRLGKKNAKPEKTKQCPSEGVVAPKSIAQLVPSMESGGVEQGTLDLANFLVRRGYRSLLLTRGGRMVARAVAEGTEWIPGRWHSKQPWVILWNVWRLVRWIRHSSIDILHVRSRAPAWSAWLAARWCRIPLVSTFHGYYRHGTWWQRLYNSAMLRADHVIAGSEFIAAHIRDCYDFPPEGEMHRLSVIARGIDTDYFSPETVNKDEIRALRAELGCGEARILLMPARWSAWKGHATVLEALALLPSDLDYCMVFIGKEARPGRWRHELESRFLGHPAEKRLRRVASSGSMAAWYALSYGVLMPSTAPETFGRVAVEAQAMERPIIATSLGATSETIVDSRTGWLVPPENPVALAEAMAALLRLSAEDYEAMGKAGRRHATERFALETMCEKTVEVYERLMRGA